MNLTIDIGNTRAKMAVFDGPRFVTEEKYGAATPDHLLDMVRRYRPDRVACCSVGAGNDALDDALTRLGLPLLRVTGRTPAPVKVCYRSPQTLGADRLAAVVGAVTLMPHTDLLVVDAGTCITCDLVDAAGNYLGGNISPGVEMRLDALHERTARLPRVEADGDTPDLGYDTETAIRAGVVRGIGYELQGCIRHWQKRFPRLRIFLTGGDRYAFSDAVRKDILTDSHLVARGLNRLLEDYGPEACGQAAAQQCAPARARTLL